MKISEKNYNDFKCLLEYFVAHLELLAANLSISKENDFSTLCQNANWDIQDPRRIRIQETLSSNIIGLAGQGYNNGPIQQQIQKWANFNGKRICITVQKGNPQRVERLFSRSTYLQWENTGYNIRCNWNADKTKVDSLYVVNVDKKPEQVILTRQINCLNLFVKESTFTNELVDFFNTYYGMITNKFTNVIKLQLESNHNLILTGAPGTGKTYLAKEITKSLAGNNYEMVQFHPSYDYSDFVEGLRPKTDKQGNIGFERKDGVFKAFCKKALEAYNNYTIEEDKEKKNAPKFVFIIDEINRGEISKIFGELFFSIDPGYRGIEGAIKTQYANLNDKPNEFDKALGHTDQSDEETFGHFFVPKNVYIIGTMNDIDRSVESMDFAMRRRFAFKEITADERIDMWADAKLQDVNDEIKNHMQCLNYAIQLIPGLSSAYHVGPSYFLSLPNTLTNDVFKALWNSRLKGLLFEYLRGMPNAEVFLDKLEAVYNNATCLDDSKKQDIENKMKA